MLNSRSNFCGFFFLCFSLLWPVYGLGILKIYDLENLNVNSPILHEANFELKLQTQRTTKEAHTDLLKAIVDYLSQKPELTLPSKIRVVQTEGNDRISFELSFIDNTWQHLSTLWERGNPVKTFWSWELDGTFTSGTKSYDRQGFLIQENFETGTTRRIVVYTRVNGRIQEISELEAANIVVKRYDEEARLIAKETWKDENLSELELWWYRKGSSLRARLEVYASLKEQAVHTLYDDEGRIADQRWYAGISKLDARYASASEEELLLFVSARSLQSRKESSYDESGRLIRESTWINGIRTSQETNYEADGSITIRVLINAKLDREHYTNGEEKVSTYYQNEKPYLRVSERAGKRYMEEDIVDSKVIRLRKY